jgi:hypothetical protein
MHPNTVSRYTFRADVLAKILKTESVYSDGLSLEQPFFEAIHCFAVQSTIYELCLVYNVYASSIKIIHPTQNATNPNSIFIFIPEFNAINSPPRLLEGAA